MRGLLRIVALLLAVTLTSCGGSDSKADPASTAPVKIGTMNFPESEIVGELYKQALEAKGIKAELQSNLGPRELTNRALRAGNVDMYPEYIGVLLSEIHGVEKRPESPQAAYKLAKGLEEKEGFTLLAQTSLSNENALAVLKSFAEQRGVTSIPDLAKLRRGERVGAPPEFRDRFEGLVGLRRLYGLDALKIKDVDVGKGEQYPAIDDGKIAAALVFTTDSKLANGRYTILRDPKAVFAANHVAPLINRKVVASHGPQLAQTLNAVSALLTTPVMRDLNAKAAKQSPQQIAAEFLAANGLT